MVLYVAGVNTRNNVLLLIAKGLNMCFIFHSWKPWSRPVRGLGNGRKYQYRECFDCGKIQARLLMEDSEAPIESINKVLDQASEDEWIKMHPKWPRE